jgi:hypothetical protein
MHSASTPNLRFVTVRDLYAAFPTAAIDVSVRVNDEPSLGFVRRLVADGDIRAALSYCAYLLPRREAVWWGCQCVRSSELRAPGEAQAIAAAETWVREPSESNRRTALDRGTQSSPEAPSTWLALAAGWSGGSLSEKGEHPIPAPPEGTAQGIRCAVLLARGRLPRDRSATFETGWLDAALRYAVGDLQQA